jgi:C_GCAxxG_C_C family probable redox protein
MSEKAFAKHGNVITCYQPICWPNVKNHHAMRRGTTRENRKILPKIATGAGAGFSLNGLTCGSISGAAMAIGIKYGRKTSNENPHDTWSRVDKFIQAFKQRWEATTCRELTGLDIKTQEGFKEYYKNVHDYACTERIKFAVKKAIELLE